MNLYVLTLACLCAGLLFDPNGFLRMSLAASVIHEAGHVAAYLVITKKMPPLKLAMGGIVLESTKALNRRQELIVTALGPLSNFAAAAAMYALSLNKASYMLYFFMCINLCVGAYNLLPFGVLDGARLIGNIIPPSKINVLYIINKIFVILFSAAVVFIAIISKTHIAFKAGLAVTALYIAYNEVKK